MRASAVAVLAPGAILLGAAGGVAGTSYPTVFTKFKLKTTSSERTFKGQISSSKGNCVKGRKAKLIRKHNGDQDSVGSDKTNGKGKFEIDLPRSQVKDGKYYAKVKSSDLNNGKCAKATSGSIKISSS